jgi:glutamate synthase (NADPH/NADH) small chain
MQMSVKQAMAEQSPETRRNNFNEVALGYSEEEALLEAGRCLVCKKPGCVTGCPVNIDIPGFISQMQSGNLDEAVRILKKDNALPAVCGRVCPQEQQCEQSCVLGKKKRPGCHWPPGTVLCRL